MNKLIVNLDKWLSEYRIDYLNKLNPPASHDALTELEQLVGIKVPIDFKKLIQWKNGQSEWNFNTFDPRTNEMFMSISSITYTINEMRELLKYGDINIWRNNWVPFMDNGGGNYTCLDFESGAVIYWDHEDQETQGFIVYANIKVWLKGMLKELSKNNFEEWDFEECRKDS